MLNVGFIGCGGFVQGNHLPNAAANPELRVHALCDLNTSLLERLARQFEPAYASSRADRLFNDPELDLIVIGTKPTSRVSLIRGAAEAGKAIYVEKPLSMGWEDSVEILDILDRHPVKLQVGFNRPYSPIMQEVRRIFRLHRGESAMISYRICGEFQLFPQHHKDSLTVHGESAIIHEGVHVFDLLNWLTESEPHTISCLGGRTDDNVVVLEYPDQTTACIVASNQSTEGFPKERLEVFTNYGTIVMNEFLELQVAQIPGENDRSFALKSFPGEDVHRLRSEAELRRELKRWRNALTPEEIETGYYYGSRPCVNKGHYEALEHFRICIEEDLVVETGARRGALATIMGLEGLRSLRERRVIELDFSPLGLLSSV